MEINPAVTFKHDRKVMYAKRPKVLIVGAGLGGLTLAAILQKSDIPFEIFERAAEVKPLGSAVAFGAAIAPLFHQLGIWDEFVALGKQSESIKIYNHKREYQYHIDLTGFSEVFGSDGYVLSRATFYDLMSRQIPSERIHLGKKILSTKQGGNGILIRCSDGSEFEGDILVGADGAYSAVRQNLYAELRKAKRLPASDALPLPFCTVCLVGQTQILSADQFPEMAKETSHFVEVFGEGQPYAWVTLTTEQNTICWMVIQYLDDESSKENDSFRCSEWGPEAAAAMCDQVRHLPVVSEGMNALTLGDLIDLTPKEFISKAMLEEKVFKTWYDCRTVLIGDACHKFNPAGGVGAMNAMHDAISLANNINALPFHPIADEITQAFKAYQDERLPWVQEAFDFSKVFRVMTSKSIMGKLVRVIAKHMPLWMQRRGTNRMSLNRPQVAFLPRYDDIGTLRPAPQPSLNLKAPTETQPTRPLSVDEYPAMAKKTTQFNEVFDEGQPYAWATLTTEQNTIFRMVIQYLDEDSTKENDASHSSEWGSEAAEAMCDQVHHLPVVSGSNKVLTIGDLIDLTPKGQISKVTLEEKVFQTWHDGRTDLLGDACHKFNPSGGVGAMNAMHDATVLANYINTLPFHPNTEEITQAFKAYKDERLPWIQEAFDFSKVFRVIASKTIAGKLMRVVAKYMPLWMRRRGINRMSLNRPQVAFLPRTEDTRSIKAAPQPSLNVKTPVETQGGQNTAPAL
ncbi:hypothetical protein BGX33_009701 [Mortierella sp. NVP41]|nr:hypothetical protein BGX33_009701 [Mortierella sp. NVP41]